MLEQVGLNGRSAQIYMRLARNSRFVDASADSYLPASPGTLDMISKLSDDDYRAMRADGTINPNVSGNEIRNVLRKRAQQLDEQRVLNLVPSPGQYRGLVLDPPHKTEGEHGCDYASMSFKRIAALPVPQWVPEGHVWLWLPNSEVENGYALFNRWDMNKDFRHLVVWNKTFPNGSQRMGGGHTMRAATEFVLFGRRGNLPIREAGCRIPDAFEAPVGRHSEKHEKFYEIVRAISFPPYGEAFQRKPRDDFANVFVPRD